MSQLLKCGSYLRISKEDMLKNDESSSITSQKMIIESFARFNNFNVIETYIDDGYSGGNYNRPAFQRMIKDIESGKINCVITKDLARLGRELYETGGYIEDYFLEKNIRYIAINDSYDSKVGDSMLGIRLGVNDLYLRDVSKRVKTSMRAKQEAGQYIGSIPCYGYIKNPDNRHQLIPDEKVVSNVKMIYNLALEGYTIYNICNQLTDLKIPIPIVYKKETRAKNITENDGYGIWKYSTVENILTSQMYIGNMVQRTYEKVSYRSKRLKKIPNDQLVIVENTHESIIDKKDFEKVQEILKSRTKFVKKVGKKYLFTGLLKCKECGASLGIIKKINKKNNSYFTQCNLYRKKGRYGACTQHRLNYTWLEEDLLDIIKNICKTFLFDYDSKDLIERANETHNKNYTELKNELELIESDLYDKRNIVDNLYKDKVSTLLSEQDFKRMYKMYSEEIDTLKSKKELINKKMKQIKTEISCIDYEETKKTVLKFMSMKKVTPNVLSQIINRVEVNENKEVDIYFNFKELSIVGK